MSISDEQLRKYIDQVFEKYDHNHTFSLRPNELAEFFNDIFAMSGNPTRISQQQAMEAMQNIDQNGDGLAQKPELFAALKKILQNKNKMPGGGG